MKGYKETELGLIPEEWNVVSFGSLFASTQSGLSRRLSEHDIGLPVLRSNNMCEQHINFDNIKYWYKSDTQGSKTEDYFLKDGDIVLNFINSLSQIGKCALFTNTLNRNIIFTTNLMRIKLKENIYPKIFLAHTASDRYKQFIQAIAKPAVNQASFTGTDYKKYLIPLPTKKEQEKISDIILSLEKNIDILERIIEKKQLKYKALLQKIFYGRKKLQKYIVEVSAKNTDGKITDILSITNSKGFIKQDEKFERIVAGKDLTNYRIVSKGQFAYNPSRINVGSVALMTKFDKGIVSPLYIVFETDENFLLKEYFKHFFSSLSFLRQINIFSQGGVRSSLSFGNLKMMSLNIPDIKTQKSVSCLLNDIVEEMDILKVELDKLKIQKKGLIHKLITGKIRVKI